MTPRLYKSVLRLASEGFGCEDVMVRLRIHRIDFENVRRIVLEYPALRGSLGAVETPAGSGGRGVPAGGFKMEAGE